MRTTKTLKSVNELTRMKEPVNGLITTAVCGVFAATTIGFLSCTNSKIYIL